MAIGAVTGCGVGMSPEHRDALAKIQQIGGVINFAEGGYRVDLSSTQAVADDLACLKDIDNLKEVDLRGTLVTDAGAQHLKAIPNLEFIRLERCNMTREGVDDLKQAMPEVDVMY